MTVTVHEARTYNPTCKMIFLILSFTILICVNPIKSGATTPEDSNILGDGNGVKCEEMNKPGWSILSLANKTLDAWPWSCLNSRYNETTLNEEISKFCPDIFDATTRDHIGYVQYYFERRGVDLCDNVNENGEKPMHVAIAKGHLRIVKYFLTNDFSLNCKLLFTGTNEDFFTPPMSAAITGQLDILKYLLKEMNMYKLRNFKRTSNEYLNWEDPNYLEIALAAAKGGQQHELKYLFDEEGFIVKQEDEYLLALAAYGGNVNMLKYLIYEKNMDATRELTLAAFFHHCENLTLLCNAAAGGKLDAVIFLFGILNRTQNINYDDKRVWSRLLVPAVKGGNLPMIKYVIEEKGADLNSKSGGGDNLLHVAANNGHLAVVKYLVELKNINVDLTSNKGATPLYEAISTGRLDVVKYLAGERNSSLNILPGSNALLEASGRAIVNREKMYRLNTGNGKDVWRLWALREVKNRESSNEIDLKIVQFLVDNMKMISRIDEVATSSLFYLNGIDKSNKTAAMKAASRGKLDVLKFLIDDRHANTTIMPPTKATLLHFAAGFRDTKQDFRPILKYLIEEKGFKVGAKTSTNKTVFDIARISYTFYGKSEILAYLKEKLVQELSTKSQVVN